MTRRATDHTKALDAFIAAKFEIDTMLARLAALSADHFDTASIRQMVPMQRAGTAAEVAALVAFLASDAAGYITGQVISINGGMA